MRPTLFTIERDHPGCLSTMARPCGGDWLAEEMEGLAAARASVGAPAAAADPDVLVATRSCITIQAGPSVVHADARTTGPPTRSGPLAARSPTRRYARRSRSVGVGARAGPNG